MLITMDLEFRMASRRLIYAYVGLGELLILVDWMVSELVPRLDFLAPSDDSSFCLLWGKFCLSWVLHSKSFSVVFIPLVESKFGVDACSWGKIPG